MQVTSLTTLVGLPVFGFTGRITPVPLEIQDLLILGASIMSSAYSDENTVKSLMDAKYINSSITVHPTAIAGSNVQDLKDSIDTTLANYSHIQNMLVLVHIGGNDVTSTRPFTDMTQLERDTFVSNYEYISDAIVTAGFIPIIADLTFRRYKTTPIVTTSNEEDGSLPYNESLLYPLIQTYSKYYSHSSGESIMQFYTLMYNHPEYMSYDGVHPNIDGNWYMKEHLVDTLGKINYIGRKSRATKTSNFPIFNKQDGTSMSIGVMDGGMPDDIWISSASVGAWERQYFFGKNRAVTPYNIVGLDSFDAGAYSGGQTGDNSGFLHDYQLKNSLKINNGNFVVVTLEGLDNTKVYQIRLSGSENSGTDEQTQVSIGGVDKNYYTYSGGSANTLDGVQFDDIAPNAESKIGITLTPIIGNGYLSGIDLLETGENVAPPPTEYLDTVNSAVSNSDEVTSFTRNSATDFDLAVTTVGTDATFPRLYLLTTPSTLPAGNYIIKADVTVNSGTCIFVRTYAGTTVTDGRTLSTGSYEFNVTANGSVANVLMYFNGTNLFDINFTNISIIEA